MQFEVRIAPSIAEKQAHIPSNSFPAPKSRVNPFLPYDERLFIDKLGSEHVILLNKYCVTPMHILIITKGKNNLFLFEYNDRMFRI